MNASPWIILFTPFVSAVVIALITERSKKLSSYISVAAIAVSFVFALGVFFGPDGSAGFNWIDENHVGEIEPGLRIGLQLG